jgi:hypothetical protein
VAPPRSRPQVNARPLSAEPRQDARHDLRLTTEEPTDAEAEAGDQGLAEMAHRLEAALRKPNARPERSEARETRPLPMPRAPTQTEHAETVEPAAAPAPPPPAPARAPRTAEAKPPRGDAKQAGAGKALYDSLEQEMASLLGRPTGKN